MAEQEKIILQIELLKAIIDKTKEYGEPEQVITVSIFKEILIEVLTDKQLDLIKTI